jgi:Uma2 family endonuclease
MMKSMQSEALVSVEQYLNTSYRPDREYIEGRVLERNLGERDHSRSQTRLILYLGNRASQWGIHVYAEQRVQVKRNRVRVPDICAIAGEDLYEQIFTHPPFLCIEILSKDDRMSEMVERVDDYLAFGVRYAWVLDPRARAAHIYDSSGGHELKDGMLWTSDPEILVPFGPLFD